MNHLPDGYFVGEQSEVVLWDKELTRESRLARGYRFDFVDVAGLGNDRRRDVATALSSFLAGLGGFTLQLQWERTTDFEGVLETYRARSDAMQDDRWSQRVRERRIAGLEEEISAGQLHRERLTCWLAKDGGEHFPRSFRSATELNAWASGMGRLLDETMQTLALRLPRGCSVEPLGSQGQFRALRRFFQPGIHSALDSDVSGFRPDLSLLDNCLASDVPAEELGDGGRTFKVDGLHHAVLVLDRWPASFFPGMLLPLLRARVNDYRLMQTFRPRSKPAELAKARARFELLLKRARLDNTIDALVDEERRRIADLQNGNLNVISALMVLTVWDTTADGLASKVSRLKLAFGGVGSAGVHYCTRFAQAVSVYSETFPGRMPIRGNRSWDLVEDNFRLARFMLASSSYMGSLRTGGADAIFHTSEGGIAGVEFWRGGQAQHSVLVGGTGAGKSVFMASLISEVMAGLDFVCIVEEGMSHYPLARVAGLQTVVVRPDTGLTLNLFDTYSLPLSSDLLGMVTALLCRMAGVQGRDQQAGWQRSILARYVDAYYTSVAEDLWGDDEELSWELAAESLLLHEWRKRMPRSPGFLDAWAEARDYRAANPEAYDQVLSTYRANQEVLLAWMQSDEGARVMRDLTFTRPGVTMPTLGTLVSHLNSHLFGSKGSTEADTAKFLGAQLTPWCSGQAYGGLFDGEGTLDITEGRGLHFELGQIPEGMNDLKDVCALYLSAFIRAQVLRRRRGERKLLVFDEFKRFRGVPEGERFVLEGYEQLRKFNCSLAAMIQSLTQIADSPALLSAIFNNSTNYFLMQQNGAEDLALLSRSIAKLPDVAAEIIGGFTSPSTQPAHSRASWVYHVTAGAGDLHCGVLRVKADPEMLWVAECSADSFEEKARAFDRYDDPLDAVVTEAFIRTLPPGSADERVIKLPPDVAALIPS